jgi:hypothetical protein
MTFGAYRAFQAWARSTRAVRNHFFLLMTSVVIILIVAAEDAPLFNLGWHAVPWIHETRRRRWPVPQGFPQGNFPFLSAHGILITQPMYTGGMDSGYEGYESSLLLSPPSVPVRVQEIALGDNETIDFKNLPDAKELSIDQAR